VENRASFIGMGDKTRCQRSLRLVVVRVTGVLLLLILEAASGAASAASRPLRSHRGRFEATPRFVLTYIGSGRFHTGYHSTPPNPGGLADTNDADDSSAQRWAIKFDRAWAIPRCGATRRRPTDPCSGVGDFLGAHGASTVTGRVSHRHVDGLFPSQDASISCRVSFSTPKRWPLRASVRVRYLARRHAFSITALNPVFTAVNDLPPECPGQGDPIDGLFDNYYTPGFSFSSHYGPDRWFTSAATVVPLRALRRSSLITLALHQTRSGTPPRNCAVPFPAYQRCSASGSWAGALRLHRVG
jgi:hypothetical protein